MWFRLRISVAVIGLLVLPVAAPESFSAPPANDDCLACHGDASAARDDGRSIAVQAEQYAGSSHGPLACVDCHADLASAADFPHAAKLAKVACASCHADIGTTYHDSIHAWASEKAGLVSAPTCVDCHGRHDIRPPADPTSRVNRLQVPATCGKCHVGLKERYDAGIHAAALKQGNARAPGCADCHTAHAIQRADTDVWRLSVTAECGTCHAEVVGSFRRTFHGKVTEMGFGRVAACADCHGAHDILPASNPASMVSRGRLVQTCSKCHQGVNDRFIQYDPHPDPRNFSRSPLLWWINRFYTVLIAGCFGFFGLHSLLWFRRSARDRRP